MTDSTAVAAFSAHAPEYDALRRRLVPDYDRFYGTVLDVLGTLPGPPKRVLDLGAGTGLVSAMVADRFPAAELVLVDGAAPMLDEARAVLGSERAAYVVADLRDELPSPPYCAVVSALAIHHLEDDEKRALFARVHAALKPGGVFVNAEQILAADPAAALEWHRRASRALGTTDDEWDGALERMTHDRPSTVPDQVAWLRAAGFADVAVPFANERFAVFAGRRAATRPPLRGPAGAV